MDNTIITAFGIIGDHNELSSAATNAVLSKTRIKPHFWSMMATSPTIVVPGENVVVLAKAHDVVAHGLVVHVEVSFE